MTVKAHKDYLRKINIVLGAPLVNKAADEIGISIDTYDVTENPGLKEDFYTSKEEIDKKYIFKKFGFKFDNDWCAVHFRDNLLEILAPILSENIHEFNLGYKFDCQLKTINIYVGDKRVRPEFLLELIEYFEVARAELKYRSGDFAYPWILKLTD